MTVFSLQHLPEKTVKRRNQYHEEQDQAVFAGTLQRKEAIAK